MLRQQRVFGVVVITALLLLAGAVEPMPVAQAAAIWQMSVGAASIDHAVQVNYFLPREVWIHAGDSVTWTWKADEPHTVSFLNGQPPAFNLLFPYGGSSYNGTSQVSSGARSRLPFPPLFLPPSYNLTFTQPGDYQFNCLFHPPMTGIVHVRPAGSSLPHDQAWYDQLGQASATKRLDQGDQLENVALQSTHYGQDTAGIGEVQDTGSIAVLRFSPDGVQPTQPLAVKVNETVVFTNLDPQTPHTVTFGPDGAITQQQAVSPAGTDGTGHATISSNNQVVNSGSLWSDPLPGSVTNGATFSVKFTAPGIYNFRCEFHDILGMEGVVTVTN